MTEHIRDSMKPVVETIGSIVALLFGIWWGIRTGDGIRYLTGADFRLPFVLIMLIVLIFQGYSSIRKNRHYSFFYRGMVWISGILVSLLVYELSLLIVTDILILLLRWLFHVQCAPGYNAFFLVLLGSAPHRAMAEYAMLWGNPILNYDAASFASLAGAIVLTIYGAIHAQHLTVTRYQVSFPQEEKSKGGSSAVVSKNGSSIRKSEQGKTHCRIVHLSDLHMGSVISSSYIRRVLSEVDRLKPDYVVITGDIFNHGFVEECADSDRIARYFRDLNETLSSAEIPYRIYAVCGNHDPLPTDPALKSFLEKADIRLLKDEIVHLPEFDLAGRDSNHMDHRAPLKDWLKVDRPLILLDHYPDGMQEAAESGVSLFLCGHTHGGQYFPCNLLIRKRYSKKEGLIRGISQHEKMTAIVSLGTGFFQIPIRVGTDSEIISIDLSI